MEKRGITNNVVIQGIAVAVLIAFVIFISLRLVESDVVRDVVMSFGYVGVFFISVVSGFSLAVPIPTVAFVPLFIGSGLSIWPLLVVMTLGMTFGDAIGYFVGGVGRKVAESRTENIENGRAYRFMQSFHDKHRLWPFVVLSVYISFVPAPNEVLVIPMAFMGYRLRYMFPIIFIGNFIFNIFATFSLLGIISLL